MAGEENENLVLEDEDQVRVHSIWEGKYRKVVTASGEVNSPGDFVLTEGMKLSDLIFKAGGFKESAYGREAELVRREIAPGGGAGLARRGTARGGDLVRTETLVVSPEKAISGDPKFDVPLKERDLLVVRQIPARGETIPVT